MRIDVRFYTASSAHFEASVARRPAMHSGAFCGKCAQKYNRACPATARERHIASAPRGHTGATNAHAFFARPRALLGGRARVRNDLRVAVAFVPGSPVGTRPAPGPVGPPAVPLSVPSGNSKKNRPARNYSDNYQDVRHEVAHCRIPARMKAGRCLRPGRAGEGQPLLGPRSTHSSVQNGKVQNHKPREGLSHLLCPISSPIVWSRI